MPDEAKFKPQKEINRLKAQARKLEKEKERSFPGVGRAAYEAFLRGAIQEPSVVDPCRQIQSLDSQMEQLGAEISRLQEQAELMKAAATAPPLAPSAAPQAGPGCPFCGVPVSPGTCFCGNCGQAFAAPAQPPAALCPACGTPVAPGVRFCGECGKPVETAPAPPAPQPPSTAGQATASTATAPPAPPPPPVPPRAGGSPEVPAETAGPRVCPACGAPADETDAAFCGECGSRIS